MSSCRRGSESAAPNCNDDPGCTTSIGLMEALEALQRANVELKKKIGYNTKAMDESISFQKAEIVQLEQELVSKRGELAHSKRTEKELQTKNVFICVVTGTSHTDSNM